MLDASRDAFSFYYRTVTYSITIVKYSLVCIVEVDYITYTHKYVSKIRIELLLIDDTFRIFYINDRGNNAYKRAILNREYCDIPSCWPLVALAVICSRNVSLSVYFN